jgi:hypothetical protein
MTEKGKGKVQRGCAGSENWHLEKVVYRDKRGTFLLRWRDRKVKVAPGYLLAIKYSQDQMKNITNFNVIKYL